jgi:uncharacterized protein YkwD
LTGKWRDARRVCNRVRVLRALLSALAAVGLLVPVAASAGTASSQDTAVLREMNRVRAQYGLRALRVDTRLQRAARAHSREMVAGNIFEHGDFAGRIRRFRVVFHIAGENIAWGTGSRGSARAIVAGWLASPPHRENLLRRSFTRVGVGDLAATFLGYRGAHVVTADFAG